MLERQYVDVKLEMFISKNHQQNYSTTVVPPTSVTDMKSSRSPLSFSTSRPLINFERSNEEFEGDYWCILIILKILNAQG